MMWPAGGGRGGVKAGPRVRLGRGATGGGRTAEVSLTLIAMRTNANSSPSRCSPRESVSSLTAPPCLPKTRPSLQLHLLPNEQHAPHAMMLDFDTRQHELTGPLHEHELVHQMTC